MTSKQKKMLARIIASAIIYIIVNVVVRIEALEQFLVFPAELILFLIPYALVGWDIVYKAVRNIFHGQIFDENFLMFIATIGALAVGEYSEAVAVMLFYQVGELFQNYAVNRSRQSISELMDICPEYANIETEEGLQEVDPDEVEVGTVIVVKPGERIPLDGIVVEGESMVDTSSLTGESVPRHVSEGKEVISGCVNGSGLLKVKTTKEFDDSTVAKILELVENASSKKAKVENFITRFARYYTPVVVCGAVLLAVIPSLIFGDWMNWIQRACIFLVISCPCALVISVPLSFFGGIGAASKSGILVKGSNFLELVSDIDTVVFDKTGTLTKGEFVVTDIIPAVGIVGAVGADTAVGSAAAGDAALAGGNLEEREASLLELAALAESYSDHPVAQSIKAAYAQIDIGISDVKAGVEKAQIGINDVLAAADKSNKAQNKKSETGRVADCEEISGHGIKAVIDGRVVLAGNDRLMAAENIKFERCNKVGTVVYLAADGIYQGCIVIADTVKEGAKETISAIKALGVRKTVMLTGDRKEVGEAVAKELGIDCAYTQLLPADKVSKVEELLADKKNGSLAFVGDGINDAPVLTRADVGIAMGSMGSDAAIEAADIVLMDDDTRKIARVTKISRKTLRIVKQNIIFALGVKGVILLLGAFGMANMWEAVFADVGVSVIAILNAMRVMRTK